MFRILSKLAFLFGVIAMAEETSTTATAAPQPWNEIVKYEANHKGQKPFTVEQVDAFRVPSGKLVTRTKHTKIKPQPGDRVTLWDGTVIIIRKVKAWGDGTGYMIEDPIPPASTKPKEPMRVPAPDPVKK